MSLGRHYSFIAGVILLLLIIYSFSESSFNWTVPGALMGSWAGKQKVTIRDDNHGKYVFIISPGSVKMNLVIAENGSVSGSCGNALFENCRIKKNRGWIGKELNLFTDFVITGNLSGSIFQDDTIPVKEISFPVNLRGTAIQGTIFQHQDMADIFPMVDVNLIKQ